MFRPTGRYGAEPKRSSTAEINNSHLETSGAPVDKLNRSLGLYGRNGSIHVLRHNVTTVKHTTGHVFAMSRVAFHHLIRGFKARVSNLRHLREIYHQSNTNATRKIISYRQLFMVSFLGGNNGCVRDQRKMDSRVRNLKKPMIMVNEHE